VFNFTFANENENNIKQKVYLEIINEKVGYNYIGDVELYIVL